MAKATTRQQFIDYCLRRLGYPVIEINVADEQIEDRVDDALQMFFEYHGDGSQRIAFPILVTSTMVTNRIIDFATAAPNLADRILSVTRVFPIGDTGTNTNLFDVKYQMKLNDFNNLSTLIGDVAHYEQMQQYLNMLDMKLTGTPQIIYSRKGNQLFIQGDLQPTGDIKAGDYIMVEMFVHVSDNLATLWDDLFLKEYATALIKRQWGENMSKFEGMQLPGGVTINARQLIDDANTELDKIRERMYNEYDTPPTFFVG